MGYCYGKDCKSALDNVGLIFSAYRLRRKCNRPKSIKTISKSIGSAFLDRKSYFKCFLRVVLFQKSSIDFSQKEF